MQRERVDESDEPGQRRDEVGRGRRWQRRGRGGRGHGAHRGDIVGSGRGVAGGR